MSNITEPQQAALTRMLAEREMPEGGVGVGTKVIVSADSLADLTKEEASIAFAVVKGLPKTEAAEQADAAVYALKSGNYRLPDGTIVEWSNKTAEGKGIFAVIDGKPQWKQHLVTGRRIVAEGGKKMRATAKKKPVAKTVSIGF